MLKNKQTKTTKQCGMKFRGVLSSIYYTQLEEIWAEMILNIFLKKKNKNEQTERDVNQNDTENHKTVKTRVL